MIEIELDNGHVIYPSDEVKFLYTLYNPAFDKERGERSYTTGMFIPNTPENNYGLSYMHRMDKNPVNNQKAKLYLDGVAITSGKIKIGKTNNRGTNIDFISSGRYILDNLNKTKLYDAVGDISIPVDNTDKAYFRMLASKNENGTWNYQPLYGIEIVKNGVATYYYIEEHIDYNQFDSPYQVLLALRVKIDADYIGMSEIIDHHGESWLVFDMLLLEPDTMNSVNMQRVTDDFDYGLADQTHADIVDWIRDKVVNGDNRICFPVVHNTNFYEGKNKKWEGWINLYRSTEPAYLNEWELETGNWKYSYVPMFFFRYVMEGIKTKTRIAQYAGEPWEDADLDDLIIYNEASLDHELKNAGDGKFFNVISPLIRSRVHLPDMSCGDFLVKWLESFCLHYVFKGETIIFRKNKDQLAGPVLDWTDRCEDRYEADKKPVRNVSLVFTRDPNDGFFLPDQLLDYNSRPDAEVRTLPFSAIYMSKEDFATYPDNWLVPVSSRKTTSQAGSGNLAEGKLASSSGQLLKYMYYRGLRPGLSCNYPLATHDWHDFQNNVVGDASLQIVAQKGLMEKYWGGWIRLDPDDTVTVNLLLSIQDVINMSRWDNPKVTVYTDSGQVNIIIKDMTIIASRKGLELTKVTGVRLK